MEETLLKKGTTALHKDPNEEQLPWDQKGWKGQHCVMLNLELQASNVMGAADIFL